MSDVASRKAKKDAYANVAFGAIAMSAANTLTYSQIQMAVGLFQGVGMLLHRVLWLPDISTVREVVAVSDHLIMAITTSNRLTAISAISDPALICNHSFIGTGANTTPEHLPWTTDFTALPGGGKLMSANPIWCAMFSAGFAGVGSGRVQLDFTFVELSDRDYLELIQAQFPANVV